MEFYFIVHVIIGMIAAAGYVVFNMRRANMVAQLPQWAWPNNLIVDLILLACISAPTLAVITTFIQWGMWGFATIGEIILGFAITYWFIPQPIRYLIILASPVILTIIFGALWGFWYIG